VFNQQSFVRSSSVQIRICIQRLTLVHCVLMIITSSLFIEIERMSNDWKVEKVNYELGIGGFLRLYLDWNQKFKNLRLLKSDQP
jgi:hypothetical protein